MVQQSFTVGTAGSLATDLQEISSGGTDAAVDTAYTITLTAPILSPSESVNLDAGSAVTLEGPFLLIIDAFAATGTVTTDLDFTGTITLDDGVLDNVALTTNGGRTIIAGDYSGSVLGTDGDSGDTAINSGSIINGGTFAAIQFDTGTVQNGWNGPASALVSGVAGGVDLQAGGLVQNGGTVIASGISSIAIELGTGTVDNGQIVDTAAEISGGTNGVVITGAGVLDNDGAIMGVASDAVYLGSGVVMNGQIGDDSALIDGGPADNGLWIGTGIGTVGNFGTITGAGASGVFLEGGGTLTNGASADTGALVSGALEGVLFGAAGVLFNDGTVQAIASGATQDVIGTFLEAGGTIENLSASAMISGMQWGAVVEGGSGLVSNLGTIEASGASGFGVDLTAGGTVVNGLTAGSSATISGTFDGVRISKGRAGAGATVQNDGTITGAVGVDFESGPTPAAGTLTNDGLIASTSGASGDAVVFGTGAERLVVQSAGAFVGAVLGNNTSGSSTTLDLAIGTQGTLGGVGNDGGTVTDSPGGFVFSEIGTIVVDAGASWTVDAPGSLDTVDNAGALAISGGAVTVTGSLTNSGSLFIGGNTLVATTGLLADPGVITVGAGGLLKADGGGITAAGTSAIQVGGGASAALTVTGAGATVNSNGYRIGIGSSGAGSLLISQGGTVLAGTPFAADEAIYTGGSAGATGALTVTDPGSQLRATGQFSVGLGGDGSLLVENQATVITGNSTVNASAGFDVGQLASATGAVTVTGTGSLLDNTGEFIVGDAGLGSLAIQAGATVITTPGTVAGLAGAVIANQSGAGGSEVNVTGANSTWQLSGTLLVGNADEGLLNIAAGATVTAASLDAGVLAGSDGNIAVTGTNTALNLTGQLTVGDQSTADLLISNDATVTALNADIGLTGNAGLSPVGAGVVDLEGAGSELNILNNLNIGDGGTGVLVMDADTTLTVVNNLNIGATGALRQFGGVLDPATLTNTSESTTGSNGASLSVGRTLTNNGAYTVGPGEYTINVGTAEVSGGVTSYVGGTLNGSGLLVVGADGSNGTLVVNAGTVSGGQTVEFNNQATSEILTIGTLGGFGAVISNAINPTQGMEIMVAGVSIASVGFAGTTLTLFGAGDSDLGTLAFTGTVSSGVLTTNGSGGIIEVACFAAGTRIATERGEAAVEAIAVGDRVRVLLGGGLEGGGVEGDGLEGGGLGGEGLGGGGFSEVIWVGRREIDCARHQQPRKVWPVRVAAGAFGAGLPHTDLWLSPDHAVYVNEVLIPVRYLVNGSTIAQVPVDRVTYHHIELARHDVLLAEGLPAESFLDMRDGSNYANRPGPVRLYPDYSARMWEAFGCAPLIVTGPELEAARALVKNFAQTVVTSFAAQRETA